MTAGAVAAKTVLPIGAKAAEPHPDAALIVACNNYVALELRLLATYHHEDTAAQETVGQIVRDAIIALQDPLQGVIGQTPARTLDGLRAKARALVAGDEGAINEDAIYTTDIIRSSLLRDLVDASDPVMRAGWPQA